MVYPEYKDLKHKEMKCMTDSKAIQKEINQYQNKEDRKDVGGV